MDPGIDIINIAVGSSNLIYKVYPGLFILFLVYIHMVTS